MYNILIFIFPESRKKDEKVLNCVQANIPTIKSVRSFLIFWYVTVFPTYCKLATFSSDLFSILYDFFLHSGDEI
jgi:hypothetical protein